MKTIDWNSIENDYRSEVALYAEKFTSEDIVDWFKLKIHRYDIFKAKRIKEQIDYIKELKKDESRTPRRKQELIESAEVILLKLMHQKSVLEEV